MSLSRPTTASPSLTTAAAAASPPPASFSLYSHPRLYDAVFAFRDFDAEARFLVHAWELYGEGGEGEGLSSFLDVGCGTGDALRYLDGFERYLGRPVLLSFNAGRFGEQIEAWTDEQIVAGAMDTLRRIYGVGIPPPTGYQLTRWKTDPYALGSYSFYQVGATPTSRRDLGASVSGRLFFAGEATSLDSPSTVTGAYESGQDAAEALLDDQ